MIQGYVLERVGNWLCVLIGGLYSWLVGCGLGWVCFRLVCVGDKSGWVCYELGWVGGGSGWVCCDFGWVCFESG